VTTQPATYDADAVLESALIENPGDNHRVTRIRRDSELDPQRDRFVDAAVARLLLRKMALERGHDQ
jgi:hypothetical protein